jgi:hypothetical protein
LRTSADPRLKEAAAYVIGESGQGDFARVLAESLTDPSEQVRRSAITALQKLVNPRALKLDPNGDRLLLPPPESLSPNADRLADKDAGDVMRIILTVPTAEVAATMKRLAQDPDVGDTAVKGLSYLQEQFGRRRSPGIMMATSALAGSIDGRVIAEQATGFLAKLCLLLAN